MPEFQLFFTSVADVIIEADSLEEAWKKGKEFDSSQLDWSQSVDLDAVEEL